MSNYDPSAPVAKIVGLREGDEVIAPDGCVYAVRRASERFEAAIDDAVETAERTLDTNAAKIQLESDVHELVLDYLCESIVEQLFGEQ